MMIYDLLSGWKDISMELVDQMLLPVGSVLKVITPSKRMAVLTEFRPQTA
jgi:hypothetical protein